MIYQTSDGKREFAEGDRIVFLENNRDLGVKNGMLGTVEAVEPGRVVARLDGATRVAGSGIMRAVSVSMDTYSAIDHGYATTIHKNQGATVDRAYVLASGTMDRHLTYVAMTRHREGVQLHVARDEFASRQAGVLVEHGKAPFEHDATNRASYFVTVENAAGERHTTGASTSSAPWPRRRRRSATRSGSGTRERFRFAFRTGRKQSGTWKVLGADELAWQRLEARLSRSGVKETTLDYREGGELVAAEQRFAERRGSPRASASAARSRLPPNPPGYVRAGCRRPRILLLHEDLPEKSVRISRRILARISENDARQRRSRFEGLNLVARGGRGAAGEGRHGTAQPVRWVEARCRPWGLRSVWRGVPAHQPVREAGLSASPMRRRRNATVWQSGCGRLRPSRRPLTVTHGRIVPPIGRFARGFLSSRGRSRNS